MRMRMASGYCGRSKSRRAQRCLPRHHGPNTLWQRFVTRTRTSKEEIDMATMSVEQVNIGTQVTRHGGLFDKLSADTMRELLRTAHVRTHEAGETLFCESDEADFVYIVLEGRV